MKTLFGLAPFVVALPIVVTAAIWQGKQTERWGTFPELSEAAKRIDSIPLEVGNWTGTLQPKLTEQMRRAAGAEGDAEIAYVNTKTREQVNVFVVCGRLEDVMDHRPDRCYPAHGYKPQGETSQHIVRTKSGKASFQSATYLREGQPVLDRVYWAWSKDGKWLAPEDEDLRNDFKRTEPIFKVHFENGLADAKQSLDEGPSVELIKVLIPELSRTLFPDFKAPVAAAD